MAIRTAPAIILQRWDYRETSVILSLFTEEWGKFHGLIKGFRRQPPRYKSPAMVGGLNTVVFYDSRKTSLLLIGQCDLTDTLVSDAQHQIYLQAQSRVIELLIRGTAMRDPQPAMYRLAVDALQDMRDHRDPIGIARLFELKFLQVAGLSPAVHECVHCTRAAGTGARLSLRLGGLLCTSCMRHDQSAQQLLPGTIATMQRILQLPWAQMLRLQLSPSVRDEMEQLLDRFEAMHLDTQLKSRSIGLPAHANA
jgi:DNA repair protein RecO (recombination protein O)